MKRILTLVMLTLLTVLSCGEKKAEQSDNQTGDMTNKVFKIGITQFVRKDLKKHLKRQE